MCRVERDRRDWEENSRHPRASLAWTDTHVVKLVHSHCTFLILPLHPIRPMASPLRPVVTNRRQHLLWLRQRTTPKSRHPLRLDCRHRKCSVTTRWTNNQLRRLLSTCPRRSTTTTRSRLARTRPLPLRPMILLNSCLPCCRPNRHHPNERPYLPFCTNLDLFHPLQRELKTCFDIQTLPDRSLPTWTTTHLASIAPTDQPTHHSELDPCRTLTVPFRPEPPTWRLDPPSSPICPKCPVTRACRSRLPTSPLTHKCPRPIRPRRDPFRPAGMYGDQRSPRGSHSPRAPEDRYDSFQDEEKLLQFLCQAFAVLCISTTKLFAIQLLSFMAIVPPRARWAVL